MSECLRWRVYVLIYVRNVQTTCSSETASSPLPDSSPYGVGTRGQDSAHEVCRVSCRIQAHKTSSTSRLSIYAGKTKTIPETILHVAIALAVLDHVLSVAEFKALQYTPHSNALNRQRLAYHRWSGTITWRKGLWPTRDGPC